LCLICAVYQLRAARVSHWTLLNALTGRAARGHVTAVPSKLTVHGKCPDYVAVGGNPDTYMCYSCKYLHGQVTKVGVDIWKDWGAHFCNL
jgi:hypothetical protein